MILRRTLATVASLVLLASMLVTLATTPALATPVATTEAGYQALGRVFPDPQGCLPEDAPAVSPWAKGEACATQFVQWDEALDGLGFLEDRFARYLDVLNLRTQFDHLSALDGETLQSAGLPTEDLGRDKRDLYVAKVTDADSEVPEAERKHFLYSLSIHGIERAGLEGGIRAVEDLVAWAACENDAEQDSPVCAAEDVSPQRPKQILEPADTDPDDPDAPAEAGPTAGEALADSVIYFTLSNPDGWHRGEYSEGQAFFQRYNGNGMDLNRDWPTLGYTEPLYTPFSEPETSGFGKFLKTVRDSTATGSFAAGIDLHGMLTAEAFSYTLLGAGQRDFRKNALTVDTSVRTFRDSEERLAWSPIIAPADECPATGTVIFGLDAHAQVCSDQWGTVWDTIDYQVTGSYGDWIDSPLGLDAVGIDNEMYVSHLAPNNVYDPQLEQLHIDGNKGLIYSQIASLLAAEDIVYEPGGDIGYVFDDERTQQAGGEEAAPPTEGLPTQDDIQLTEVAGQGVGFEVEGPADGVYNGGLTVEATFTNARGISTGTGAGITDNPLVLEYCEPMHPGDLEGECQEVARYFNQSAIYLQAGARIDLNSPPPGTYRIKPDPNRPGATEYTVSFDHQAAYPVPEQRPVNASRMDFFSELNDYVSASGAELEAVEVDTVLSDPDVLDRYDSVVVADELMPGYVAPEDEREAVPGSDAGDPQPASEFTVVAGTPEVIQEFDVLAEDAETGEPYDNDELTAAASWQVPSDYDLFVERLDEATGEWVGQGGATNFINTGETVVVESPEPGQWRARIVNFAAVPQPVDITVSFTALPTEPVAGAQSAYSEDELATYIDGLRAFASGGGNLVVTDAAMVGLPRLVGGLATDDVIGGFFYAGWMDFDDGSGEETYDTRPLAAGVDKEGAAEGDASLGGDDFDNRHQTYEPVPLGYYVSQSGAVNDDCGADRCDSPNWIVDQEAWEAAGGSVAARTFVRPTTAPSDEGTTGVSLGELPVGEGAVRIAGALLPEPTLSNYHPYGVADYALTYTGHQLFENLTAYQNPNQVEPVAPMPAVGVDCGDCELEVRAGESGSQTVTVTNAGNVADTYELTVTVPEGWQSIAEPSDVSLGAGEQAEVLVTVEPPRSEQKGTYDVDVTATSTGYEDVANTATIAATVTKGRPTDPGGSQAGDAG